MSIFTRYRNFFPGYFITVCKNHICLPILKISYLSEFGKHICWLRTHLGPDSYVKRGLSQNNTAVTDTSPVVSSPHEKEMKWRLGGITHRPKDTCVDVAALATDMDPKAHRPRLCTVPTLGAWHYPPAWMGTSLLVSGSGLGHSHTMSVTLQPRAQRLQWHLVSSALLNLLIKAC